MVPSATQSHYWVVLLLACLTVGKTCPANCICYQYHYVSCIGKGFSTIPDNIPTDTTTLKLAYNELVSLDLTLLYTLDRLRVLDVRANEIVTISGSFQNFPFLREVYLGQNNLTTVFKKNFGDSFEKLAYIDLTGNPFDCQCGSAHECSDNVTTCDILWLKGQIHQNIDRVGRDVLCQNPYEVRGQFIDDVNISDSKCISHANNGDNLGDDTLGFVLLVGIVMLPIIVFSLLDVYVRYHSINESGKRGGHTNKPPSTPNDDTNEGHHTSQGVTQQMKDEAGQSKEVEMNTVEADSEKLHGNETENATEDGIQSCSTPSSLSDIPASCTVPIGEKNTMDVTIEPVPADAVAVDLDKNVPMTGENPAFVPDENCHTHRQGFRRRSFKT